MNAERYQVHQAAQQAQPSVAEPSMMAMAMAYPPPQQHGLRIAPPRPPETPLNRCWGAELKGGDATTCQPGFQCGKVHFKNKFCWQAIRKTHIHGLRKLMRLYFLLTMRGFQILS